MINLADKKIILTGGAGFLGSFVKEKLQERGCKDIFIPNYPEIDLTKIEDVKRMYKEYKADVVIHLAGDVGGIAYNRANPGSVFYNNLMMNVLVQDEAYKAGVSKFVGIGSVCSYPKFAKIPFVEEDLWEGYPEETNATYGLAKKVMLEQSKAYRQQYGFNAVHLLMINLYGPRDNFDLETSHVIPALIRKFVDAKKENRPEVAAWGDGSPTREFIYAGDAAEAIVLAAEKYESSEPVNIGSGMEISIKDLTEVIAKLVGYEGKIVWDTTKPNGQPRRCLDVSKAKEYFGYEAKVKFEEGLKKTIEWYRNKI